MRLASRPPLLAVVRPEVGEYATHNCMVVGHGANCNACLRIRDICISVLLSHGLTRLNYAACLFHKNTYPYTIRFTTIRTIPSR